ncbi:hypothetical protein PAXINDRAFT_15460 [Paxillus involutus ATCC 200175]|uniref:Unplaced genomic scaffold PAXINscaffold_53, whole genome shotgun sequence n=1 Tax=Paxillus involutus ATCC 200175 TaxID=664439 RepID=A0A0C9SSZ4_PAXIN|nr:hypothetical protein PAXINDRAFT_15460 [Paxillus involutus ATCC 200175]
MCADALHDPGGKTKEPPSVRLKGEMNMETSQYVKLTDVKTSHINTEEDNHDNQPTPRVGPVGMPDSDSCRPNGHTEPPDKEKGAWRRNSEMKVDKRVETVEEVEMEELRQVDEPGDEEVERS